MFCSFDSLSIEIKKKQMIPHLKALNTSAWRGIDTFTNSKGIQHDETQNIIPGIEKILKIHRHPQDLPAASTDDTAHLGCLACAIDR